jgi:transposase
MRDTSLLQLALGVAPPWTVVRSDFDTVARRLDIYIDFTADSRFTCPSCGAADCPAHDTEQVKWRHLNFFQHQTYLHAPCATCVLRRVRGQEGQRAPGQARGQARAFSA